MWFYYGDVTRLQFNRRLMVEVVVAFGSDIQQERGGDPIDLSISLDISDGLILLCFFVYDVKI